ncbi:hypothetical protein LSAT2_009782 [Lamellibrachia satsuma]|nr:hypothetical protein LSAT2_009782 [Lamellibrachia satsuma]
MLDVTKQKNLSGFYRHLLNQTTGEEPIPEGTTSSIAVKKEKVKSASTAAEVKKEWPEDGDIGHSSSSGSDVDSNVSAGSEDEQHRGEEKHGHQHREHHQKDYVGEDKDHSRKELGGALRARKT